MELPIIIAVIVGVIYTIAYILVCIIREWWKMKNDQPRISIAERFKLFDELIQKTKQMERDQIIEAYHAAVNLEYHLDMPSPKEYYEQTYGGNK